jgi:integrase/recombinase XerD
MEQAARLPQPYRAATYWTLLGLLSCTGMRVGEALRLDRSDMCEGLVHVNDSKFGVSWVIPIDSSTIKALEDYASMRDAKFTGPDTEAFFVSLRGTRLIYNNVHILVQELLKAAGIQAISRRHRPRIHDLRYAFATATPPRCLCKWA